MMISPVLTTLIFLVLNIAFATTPSRLHAQLLPQLPGFPLETNSTVSGSLQCTTNSDAMYAVCGSEYGTAVKYNLLPFAFAAAGPLSGNNALTSCDLYETPFQSTSRVVCAQQSPPILMFLQVSDMTQSASVALPNAYFVLVDTPNQVAYVSNYYYYPATIYKIINIASSSPSLAGNITWGQKSGDAIPCALLIIGDFLYVHLSMNPARLARFRISNFSHDKTVAFVAGEHYGYYDNLANDFNFIYDLTEHGILVRCTFQNNNFARFDSLGTGFTLTYSLSISPDLKTLFFTAQDQNTVVLVDVATFNTTEMTGPIIPGAFGRPIAMSNGIFYAFSMYSAPVFEFKYCIAFNATFGGSSKIICPAGYFCPDPNATSPTLCGPGKFTPSEGWCSCFVCAEHFFCPSNTTVDPEPCPAGSYCPNTTSSIPCPCGSFCPSGSSEPSLCNAGTFNPNNRSVSNKSCEMCAVREYCLQGSCSSSGCVCGTYCSSAGPANCTAGYYNSDPSYFCSLCPEGFYCPLERTCAPVRCDENHFCPPGTMHPSLAFVTPLPNSPVETKTGYSGSNQCTKNSDETYAVCGSYPQDNFQVVYAVRYNLRPFSFALKGVSGSCSCDLYESSALATSRAICTIRLPGLVSVLHVSNMAQITSVSVPNAYYVVVDTPNQVGYVSGVKVPVTISKIIHIDSSAPTVAGNISWGQNSGDQSPCALLIIDEFLYVHLDMLPARLARIRISDFSHDTTIPFINEEDGGYYDNLANDFNFIYDLTQNGVLVRCTYQNNNFARFDSLNTRFTSSYSLSISPDLQTLFVTASDQNAVVLVDVTSFHQVSSAPVIPHSSGRPIVMSNGIFYAFSAGGNQVYAFKYCMSLNSTYGGPSKNICPVGHFCPDPNATAPTPCSPGTYATGEGFCLCPFCPAGAFCASTWKTPQKCPVETYNENNGASSIAACLPCPLGKICQEGSITPIDCNQQNCDSTRNCTLYSKVLVGVTDAQPYCVVSNRSSCTSPLTCSSINLPAYDIPLQCEAAGCSFSGSSCVNRNDCFNLFLPSFVIQPLGLMFIGFAKDVVVLLLIGIFGDVLMRKVKTMMLPFKFWKNKWNRDQIKVSMETTIFANDANCRNETSTEQESFEEYCDKIAIALFELPETDDEEIRKDWKRKLVDAITFSMFDFGLWFELDEIEEENNNNNEQIEIIQQNEEINEQQEEAESNERTETSKHALSAKDEESEPRNDGNEDVDVDNDESNEVVNDEKQPDEKNEEEIQDEKNQNEEPRLQKNQENESSATLKCEETTIQESQPPRKMVLSPESFTSTSVLQQLVNAHIFSNAQCVVYFASSRNWKLRAASALNNFPSTIQLFYYISSVIIFVAFTFRDVVLDSYNQNIIGQVSNFTCGNAEKHSQSKTTYLLLGFRFLNSSSTATVILIFIKTLHAIYSSLSEKFKKLQLPQRLPILGLLTSKSTQILLIFYFLVVASFALAGVTYGLHIIPSLVVVVIAAVLLILDSAILTFVRAFISTRKARQDAHRDKVLEQVATQELPFLGLNDRTEYDTTRESLLSHSQRSLSTINDDQQKDRGEFDFITVDEAFEVAKQSVINPEPTVSLPQALLVFLLKEEIPTIVLTITLQLCFNYICLLEFGEAFGVADQWHLPSTEYEARKFNCIWGMFESDVSSKISVLTSFVGFL